MEFVLPEEWPVVLECFRRVLRPQGSLYLRVELAPADRVRAANQAARRSGLPVVDGEVIWEGPDGYYHHYPSMGQVRTWLAGAGFTIQEEAEGPGIRLSPRAGLPGGPARLRTSVSWHLDRPPASRCWEQRGYRG
jgi:hypothetical protein